MDVLHMEDEAKRQEATTKSVPMKVTRGKGSDQKELEFSVHIPRTLEDAIKIEGAREVFGRYLRALAVDIQAKKRLALGDTGEKKERKRASYLEVLEQ